VHAESLDAMLPENNLLAAVDVPQPNVDQLVRADPVLVLEPSEDLGLLPFRKTGQEGNGHSMNVAALASLGGVDVGMRVNPDDGNLAT